MARPKIKEKLPEKLPPVEPDEKKEKALTEEELAVELTEEDDAPILTPKERGETEPDAPKEEMEVTEEKLGPEITEGFIKEEDNQEGPTDEGKPDPGTGETDAKEAPKKTTLLKYDPNIKLTNEQKEALQQEMDEAQARDEEEQKAEIQEELDKEQDKLTLSHGEKEAQQEKYPSDHERGDQPFLFGEADQILNALDTELSHWRNILEKLVESKSRIEDKIEAVDHRITILHSAVLATRKHAPMKEDPAPPKKVDTITHPTEIPEDQPEAKTTSSSTDAAEEDTTPGAAERDAEKEEVINIFRNATQPLPELLFPGDIIVTSWETGPYRVEKITGPYKEIKSEGKQIPSPDHYSIQCSDVDAKRNKDGRLPKNYDYSYLNMVIAVGNRFLSVYADSQDEVILTGEAVDKKKDISQPVQTELKDTAEEEIY